MNKLDAFSNAVVDMELVFPYSNQAIVSDAQYGEEIVYANIYGMASTNYFCIPNNPKLMGYWNTISGKIVQYQALSQYSRCFQETILIRTGNRSGLIGSGHGTGIEFG
ncbi:MAG: hypothetical protein IPN46_13970 [Saprospiraceae bacterium]|nr:hypothetical protein [Saprospiraceae bacterium]